MENKADIDKYVFDIKGVGKIEKTGGNTFLVLDELRKELPANKPILGISAFVVKNKDLIIDVIVIINVSSLWITTLILLLSLFK